MTNHDFKFKLFSPFHKVILRQDTYLGRFSGNWYNSLFIKSTLSGILTETMDKSIKFILPLALFMGLLGQQDPKCFHLTHPTPNPPSGWPLRPTEVGSDWSRSTPPSIGSNYRTKSWPRIPFNKLTTTTKMFNSRSNWSRATYLDVNAVKLGCLSVWLEDVVQCC